MKRLESCPHIQAKGFGTREKKKHMRQVGQQDGQWRSPVFTTVFAAAADCKWRAPKINRDDLRATRPANCHDPLISRIYNWES